MPSPMRCSLALAMVVLAGCRCQRGPKPRGSSVRLGLAPALTCKPKPVFRWKDALDQEYGEAFRKTFSYEKAEVVVSFPKAGPAFAGTLRARGLKPNFAYQMKLVGMPSGLWGEKGDDGSNGRIGRVGRWWEPGETGGNLYSFSWSGEPPKEPDPAKMEGYLLFGYFVTDAEGHAEVPFRVDSSFHVLWKTSQWGGPSKDDAKPTRHPVVAEKGGAYDRSFPEGEVELYAEVERGRPAIGAVRLEPGRYHCFVLLTEESFHAYGDPLAGDWAAALAAPVDFTITEPAPHDAPKPGTGAPATP